MRFLATELPGVMLVELEPAPDARGFFARTFCREEFRRAGLCDRVEQANVSFNRRAGTVRGLHAQGAAAPETKLVRCTRGAVRDVVVDARPGSPTYLRHVAVDLTAENRRAIYVPALFFHGYQTLTDDCEVRYDVGAPYAPWAETGLRFDDPALGIDWPLPVTGLSDKDARWPLLAATGGQR